MLTITLLTVSLPAALCGLVAGKTLPYETSHHGASASHADLDVPSYNGTGDAYSIVNFTSTGTGTAHESITPHFTDVVGQHPTNFTSGFTPKTSNAVTTTISANDPVVSSPVGHEPNGKLSRPAFNPYTTAVGRRALVGLEKKRNDAEADDSTVTQTVSYCPKDTPTRSPGGVSPSMAATTSSPSSSGVEPFTTSIFGNILTLSGPFTTAAGSSIPAAATPAPSPSPTAADCVNGSNLPSGTADWCAAQDSTSVPIQPYGNGNGSTTYYGPVGTGATTPVQSDFSTAATSSEDTTIPTNDTPSGATTFPSFDTTTSSVPVETTPGGSTSSAASHTASTTGPQNAAPKDGVVHLGGMLAMVALIFGIL